jgi:hypothetical protein
VKRIDITVDAEGGTTVEAHGFSGKECSDATKIIEQAIGSVKEDRKKAEYYKPSTQKVRSF